MSFKSRLQRLSARGVAAALGPEASKSSDALASDSSASQARESTDAPQDPLDALRSQLGAAFGSQGGAAAAPAVRSAPLAPPWLTLEEFETPFGLAARRLLRFGPQESFGRFRYEQAVSGSSELLSLLALTPGLRETALKRFVYFDTETTGLGGAGTLAFLIGLGWFEDDGHFVVEQLFLREPSEESAVLWRVRMLVESSSALVSFNGKSFDLPLLKGRALMNGAPAFAERPHLDLLHLARRLHKRRLASCSLKALESEVLSFARPSEDVSGADIAPLYGHYLRTGDLTDIGAVILHNEWDVCSMAALVALYSEPLTELDPDDLVSAAETLRRARAFERAIEFADRALAEPADPEALLARARIHKAAGDKARALRDFEAHAREVDSEPARLELAKLYEHYQKRYGEALAQVELGTGESDTATELRRQRLGRKLDGF